MSDAPSAAPLPSADELLGKPTADDLLGPETGDPGAAYRGRQMDQHFMTGTLDRLMTLFGQGAREGWGAGELQTTREVDQALRDAGIFNDWRDGQQGILRSYNEELIRPAITALDRVVRAGLGLVRGYQTAAAEGLPDLGVPQRLARDIAALPEAFPFGVPGLHGTLPRPTGPGIGADIGVARDLGIIGQGEDGWLGTKIATPEETNRAAVAALAPEPGQAVARQVAREPFGPPPAPPDIHQVARAIAPDAFAEYDGLASQKDVLRQQLDELGTGRAQPYQTRIDDILGRVNGIEGRLTNAARDRLDQARDELADATAHDTPEMAQLRRDLMAADYRMRDLAPDVSAAYRDAAEQMPTPPEAAPEPLSPEPGIQEPVTQQPVIEQPVTQQPARPVGDAAEPAGVPEAVAATDVAPPGVEAPAAPPQARPSPSGSVNDIAGDVARRLVAAGRPREEADAAAAIVASHYEARAQRFGGVRGSAFDLYQQEGPQIRGREAGGPGGQAAGRSTLRDSRTIITLFRRADASTFLHETGHQWLDELLRDAADERAPTELKADAEAVRQWAGIGATPTRRQHEQFARGFEAYMMEGRAPSPALAGVFGQFRQWLLQVYDRLRGIEFPIIDSVRGVYDRLVGMPERIAIAADRELPIGYHQAHEAAAETIAPEHAAIASDAMMAERARAAAAELPEAIDGERRGSNATGEAGGGTERGALGAGETARLQPGARGEGGPAPGGALGAGRGEAAAESNRLSQRPVRRTPESAYVAVPPEPVRLAEFLRRAGGIRDEGGELRAQDYPRLRPGLVSRNGLPLDEAALQAWEAGYFPEFPERPSIDDLLAALDEDLRRAPVYSQFDREGVTRFQDAVGHNAEVDRLAAELGIDPRDWTKEQFWNMSAEHLAAEKNAHLQGEIDAAHAADFAEAERRAEDWAKSRGDAWEPEQIRARTLEDIEHENRQEHAAGTTGPQPRGVAGAGPAAGDQGAVQGRGGQGGGAARARRGATAPGAGADDAGRLDAHRRFDRGDRLIDKAGNIRLDNLNQPDDVLQAIRDSAARNSDFLPERRGSLSDGEVLDLAEALGRDPAFLDRKKIGEAFNAEEVLAARGLLIQSATRVREAMMRAAEGGSADVLALAQEIKRHQIAQDVIQGKLAQATAEWGRAGRSFRMLLDGQPEAAALDRFLRDNAGYTLYQMQDLARLGRRLLNPEQVSKFIADTADGRLRRAVIYYYVNSLISGPITHARYSVGNALNALWTPLVETPVAAGIGASREALGIGTEGDRVYLGEALAQLYGLGKGTRDGWAAGVEAFKANLSPPLPGERIPSQFLNAAHDQPIPGAFGTAIGVPGRSVAAIHSFFKAIRYEQNIQALAYREAMKDGLEGDALADRIAELTTSPTEAMSTDATGNALKELYMAPSDYHSLSGMLVRATNHPSFGGFILKVLAPFMKIGSQITRNAFIERTPLGLLSGEVRGNLLSGAAAGDMQAAKITAGVGLAAATVMMTLEGLVTGDGPADPEKRAVWLLSHRPNSVQIGDITIPYQGLGHLGMLMRFAANMTETAGGWDGEDGGKLAVAALEGATRAVLDENFMRGVKDALDAVYHPQEYGSQYLKNFAVNWLPFSIGMGQVARAIDPYSREQRSILEAAEARVPLLSQRLQPRRDMFGEPIGSTTGLPQAASRYADDPTVRAMKELRLGVGRLPRKVRGVELDEAQYDDLARIGGRLAKIRLDAFTGLPQFQALPPEIRIENMHKVINSSRESARTLLMIQSPEIIGQAIAAKTKKLTGAELRH